MLALPLHAPFPEKFSRMVGAKHIMDDTLKREIISSAHRTCHMTIPYCIQPNTRQLITYRTSLGCRKGRHRILPDFESKRNCHPQLRFDGYQGQPSSKKCAMRLKVHQQGGVRNSNRQERGGSVGHLRCAWFVALFKRPRKSSQRAPLLVDDSR